MWIVLFAPAALDRARLVRIGALWATVFTILAIAFIADYTVLPRIDHRYRSAFYPGGALAAAVTQRFEAAIGRKPAYIIASMWNGGNVAHYSGLHPQPRVLIDGLPRRAPWIDLADLRARGAVVVWTDGDPQFAAGELCRGGGRCRNRRAVRSAVPQRRARAARGLGGAAPASAVVPAEQMRRRDRAFTSAGGGATFRDRSNAGERRNAELPEA